MQRLNIVRQQFLQRVRQRCLHLRALDRNIDTGRQHFDPWYQNNDSTVANIFDGIGQQTGHAWTAPGAGLVNRHPAHHRV